MIKKREGKNVATLSLQELYLYCRQCTEAEAALPPFGAIEGHNLRVKKYRGPPELVQHFRLWGSSHRRSGAACP